MPDARLMRSETDRLLAGVCGGIAAYLGIDPVFIRLAFLLLIPSGGFGIPLYLVLYLLMPAASTSGRSAAVIARENLAELIDNLQGFIGRVGESMETRPVATAVIILGVYFLVRNVTGFALDLRLVGPLLLIGLGVYLLFGRR